MCFYGSGKSKQKMKLGATKIQPDGSDKNRSSEPELIGRTLDIHMTKFVIDGFYMHM